MDAKQPSLLIAGLAQAAGEHPFERKLLVCRTHGEGRELLRALAAGGTAWVGFEATTPYALALELAATPLAEEGLRVGDEFDELALLDAAIDGTLAHAPARLRELAEGVGLRQAIGETVRALRLAGLDPSALKRARLRDREKRDALARILEAYESALVRGRWVDRARVFRKATQKLDSGTASVASKTYILPGHGRRGVSGEFLDALIRRGASMLRSESVIGLALPAGRLRPGRSAAPPSATRLAFLHSPDAAPSERGDQPAAELFAAASVTDELREVLRRVMGRGLRWDEVEIIATEPIAYGVALDSLARRLGIPVTYGVGLPFERTRPGRVANAYLRWIREDFPEDVLRALLERGDIAPPPEADGLTGPTLARRLRRMRIGRGRERYEAALRAAEREVAAPIDPTEDRAEAEEQRRAWERKALAGLGAILRSVLAATPPVPGRLGTEGPLVEPASLARGLLVLLGFVPDSDDVDRVAQDKLTARLERLAETGLRPAPLPVAIAVLLSKLETRVPSPDSGGPSPWSSAGGYLHLTDVTHGGFTGRRATFVVGLDAGRFPGPGIQDALLTDEDRRALGGAADAPLPTTAERIEEKRYALAELIARLRGNVTLSYAAWDAAETRMVPPSAEMLQAFRLVTGDALASYDDLHQALPMASAVPRSAGAIDASDVWLRALWRDGVLRSGENVVREVYRPLDRGLRAKVAREMRELTPHHGRIRPRPMLDPRRNAEVVVSASRLESLGACPRRYMLRYVLGIWPPDDPDMQPDRWLSPLDRGSLLHRVYERALRLGREHSIPLADAEFERLALDVLEREVEWWKQLVPPPGRAVFEVEVGALREDAASFVQMVRGAAGEWIALEKKFGRDAEAPVDLAVPGGTIRIMGAIDRVDRLPDGGLVIIDYKTGSPFGYQKRHGTYNGGRRLQHVLYAAVAEQLFDTPVDRAEYHFPTVKGKNQFAAYPIPDLAAGFDVVDRLLDVVAAGYFHPTDDPGDCRFCDYAVVCRVEGERSPAAAWSSQAGELEELRAMRELRRGV